MIVQCWSEVRSFVWHAFLLLQDDERPCSSSNRPVVLPEDDLKVRFFVRHGYVTLC